MRLFNFDFCRKKKKKKRKLKHRIPRPSAFYENRVRERSSSRNDHWTMTHFNTTTLLGAPLPMPYPMHDTRLLTYEQIVDSGGGLQNQWNPVDHVKWDGSDIVRPAFLYSGAGEIVADGAPLQDLFNYIHEFVPSPSPEQIDELSKEAERFFKLTVPPEVLLYNFMLELIELLSSTLEKARDGMAKQAKIKRDEARLIKEFLAKGYSQADSAFLAYMFAVLPFLGDLKKILCSIDTSLKKFNWLTKNNHKAVRRQFNVNDAYELRPGDSPVSLGSNWSFAIGGWDPANPPWEGGPAPVVDDSPDELFVSYEDYKLKFHAEALVIFHIPAYKLVDGGVFEVWASMMGLDRPAAAVWEAIPFSFIVDWLTPLVSKLVKSLDDNVFMAWPEANIIRVDHSFKLTTNAKIYVKHFVSIEDDPYEELGIATYSRYQRAHGLPEGKPSVFASPHNVVVRSALSMALLSQKLKGPWMKLMRRR